LVFIFNSFREPPKTEMAGMPHSSINIGMWNKPNISRA
jgi:hypothetical protein